MDASHHFRLDHPTDSSAIALSGSRQLIRHFAEALDHYTRRLSARVNACPGEFASLSASVFDYLNDTMPRARHRRAGLIPFNDHLRSPLEWVRFPLRDNQTLWRFAKARLGTKAQARHHRVQRTQSTRPTRVVHTHPEVYDWTWRYEDFIRKETRAQPWEATLATNYEACVAGPLRRALRAVRSVERFVGEMQPTDDIRVDLVQAEAHLCATLHFAPAPDSYVASRQLPTIVCHTPSVSIALDDPQARRQLLDTLSAPIESRLRACQMEYTVAATILRERLQAGGAKLTAGPVLAPSVTNPRGSGAIPTIVWQVNDSLADGITSSTGRWKNVAQTNTVDLARFRTYVATRNRQQKPPMGKHEFFWFTEAPHRQRDFVAAERWERVFALYYDQNVVAPLRRQWLLVNWCAHLEPFLVDPGECSLELDVHKYRPEAL